MKKNTMDTIDYIQNYAFAGEMCLLAYYYTVFVSLQGCTAPQSLLILEVALLGGLVVDLLPVFRIPKCGWSILTTMFFLLGGYTFVTYYRNNPVLYLGVLAAAAVVAIGYAVWRFPRKSSMGVKAVAAVAGIFFILCSAAIKYIPQAENVLYNTVYTDADALDAHIEELQNLKPENYAVLTVDEKIQLLQVVADIEGRYLGLDTRIRIGCSDLKEDVLGYYKDSTKEIQIDTEYLDSEPREVICLLCHEMYHAAQHEYARIYDKLSRDEKKSYFLTEAAEYAEELKHYKSGEEGGAYEYFSYYSQTLEREARAYGLVSAEQIFQRIDEEYDVGDAEAVEPVRVEENTLTALPRSETYYKDGEVTEIVNYAYDDDFTYKDTIHVQEDNAVTKVILDADGNELLSQGTFSGGILTSTYTYQYRENTDRKQVQYCYEGEGKEFSRLTVTLYNKYGEETYKLVQAGSDRIYEYRTGYTYDEQGRLSSKKVAYAMDGEPAHMTRETGYSYDENGKVDEEVLKTCMGLDTSDPSHTDKVWIHYEYDVLGREIRREQRSQTPGDAVWVRETNYDKGTKKQSDLKGEKR